MPSSLPAFTACVPLPLSARSRLLPLLAPRYPHLISRTRRARAALHPPNADADWVVVDICSRGLSPIPDLLPHAQDDAKTVVRALMCDAPAELSVVLASDAEMRAVNAAWRGVDAATDVLAFPQHDPERVVLGDVVVSLETAERQAQGALRDEVRILLLHGLLHLLGFDHEGAVEGDWLVGVVLWGMELQMAQMERRVMKQLGWKGKGLVAAAQDPFYNDIVKT